MNFVTHATWLQRHTDGMEAVETGEIVIADSGLACDTFNLVCRARFTDDTVDSGVMRVLVQFGRRPFSWWLMPDDQPRDLGAVLERHGLEASESEVAMEADLTKLQLDRPLPPSLEIRRVTTYEQLHEFARVTAANWSPPDANVIEFYDRTARAALDPHCPLRFYLGTIDGTPAATAELTLTGTTAGLYNIATLAAYRNRGIGTTMTTRPLLDARADGASRAVLQASADGLSIYSRVGFSECGIVTEYKPQPHASW